MRHIKAVADLAQNSLFDSTALDAASWWATDLDDSARRRLDEGWHGIFRRSLLQLMPAQQLGEHFDASMGRPTKELHAMAALVFIMEFKNWTNEDAADAYTFDNAIHFALNLGNRRNHLCTRTLESCRALMRDDEAAGSVFMEVTRTLVEALKINIGKRAGQDATAPLKPHGHSQATEQSQARQERARRLAQRREEQQST